MKTRPISALLAFRMRETVARFVQAALQQSEGETTNHQKSCLHAWIAISEAAQVGKANKTRLPVIAMNHPPSFDLYECSTMIRKLLAKLEHLWPCDDDGS
jgi:hypothetical protein